MTLIQTIKSKGIVLGIAVCLTLNLNIIYVDHFAGECSWNEFPCMGFKALSTVSSLHFISETFVG